MVTEDFQQRLHNVVRSGQGFQYQEWPVWKSPLDMAVYHEVLWHTKPVNIVELGTGHGGFTLWCAHLLDQLCRGRRGWAKVISVDIEPDMTFRHQALPYHPRITYLRGRSSIDPAVVQDVMSKLESGPTMVILDSDHYAGHVLRELRLYAPLVSFMQYLVIEDTDLNNPIPCDDYPAGDGPHEAVEQWMAEQSEFVDTLQSKYLVTSHTWLRRRRPVPPKSEVEWAREQKGIVV